MFLQSYQEMPLFASPDLVPLPGEKKKKRLPKNISDLTSLKSSLRKSSFPTLIPFGKSKVTPSTSYTDEKQAQTEHSTIEPRLSDLGSE